MAEEGAGRQKLDRLRPYLEGLYARYNRRELVSPDPLQFLYHYDSPEAQEVVGLVASALAYGRVDQILRSVSRVLGRIEDPLAFLALPDRSIVSAFRGIKHRFTTGEQIGRLLLGVKRARLEHGTLGSCFVSFIAGEEPDYCRALEGFAARLSALAGDEFRFLLPRPSNGSPCKRPFLYLRWMIRSDAVDPGCWRDKGVDPSGLVIPLDTHMQEIGRRLGVITARGATLATARKITAFFRQIDPLDPVKYDFVLTRFGIREDMTIDYLHLSGCSGD